jgi:histidinol-phosphate aminotransferase
LNQMIELDMNEVPYPPPPRVLQAAQEGLLLLNRYSERQKLERLRELVADYSQVPKENVVLSPGSDLVLREIIHTFAKGRKIVMVTPSFFPTVEAAKEYATELLSIRISPPAFDLHRQVLLDTLAEPSLVIIDNPNNPTGQILLDRPAVEALLANPNVLLVVDEAYHEFAGSTFADLVPHCPNLAVTRTMDKAFSLAGARVGYAIVGETFLDGLASFYAFLPQCSLSAALEALRNPGYAAENVQRVVEERERVWSALSSQDANVFPSTTNFLLMKTEHPDAAGRLEEMGILVSDLSNQLPSGFIRVSIGTREENDAFVAAYTRMCEPDSS